MSALQFKSTKSYKLRKVVQTYDNVAKDYRTHYEFVGIGFPNVTHSGCFTFRLSASNRYIRTGEIQKVKPVRGGFEFWTEFNHYAIIDASVD